MTKYIATGKTIEGNFQGTPHTSCAKIDFPTRERIAITIAGTEYERTVFERAIYRNMGDIETVARFVIVDGVQYEIVEADEEGSETAESIVERIARTFPIDAGSIVLLETSSRHGVCTSASFHVNGAGFETDFRTLAVAPQYDC